MLTFVLALLLGFGAFCGIYCYALARQEAKRDGFVSDDYIENNEEDNNDDRA